MPIPVTCQCGQNFRAKDDLAGKRVKCPKCGQALAIPGGQSADQASASASGLSILDPAPGAPIVTKCACGQTLQATADLAGKRVKCPKCGQPVTIPGGSGSGSGAGQLSNLDLINLLNASSAQIAPPAAVGGAQPGPMQQPLGGGFQLPGSPLFGKPQPKKKESNYGLVITLSAVGAFVLLAIVAVVLIIVFRKSDTDSGSSVATSLPKQPDPVVKTSPTPDPKTTPDPKKTPIPDPNEKKKGPQAVMNRPMSDGYESPDAALTAFLQALEKEDVETFFKIMRRAVGMPWLAMEDGLELAAQENRIFTQDGRQLSAQAARLLLLQIRKLTLPVIDRLPVETLPDGKTIIRVKLKSNSEAQIHFAKDDKNKWHQTETEEGRRRWDTEFARLQGKAPSTVERTALQAGALKWLQQAKELKGIRYADEDNDVQQPQLSYSWMVELLPFLGREDLYAKFNFKNFYGDRRNAALATEVIPQFLNPADPRKTVQELRMHGFGLSHFVGMSGIENERNMVAAHLPRSDPRAGMFGYDRIAKPTPQEIPDGTSNTIMLIGVDMVRPWVQGGGSTIRGAREPYFGSLVGSNFASRGHQGAIVLMADGSARLIPPSIDPAVFRAMCTIGGAKSIDSKPVDLKPYPPKPELFGGEPAKQP